MLASPSPKSTRHPERSQLALSPQASTSELPYQQLSPQLSKSSTGWTERYSSTGSSAGGRRAAGTESEVVMGKKKSYFVDVVVDGLEMDEDGGYKRPEVVADFFACLGTKIANPAGTTTTTPAKPGRVDLRGARTYIKEFYATEVNYCRKITILRDHFATPLRTRAAAHDGLLTSKQTEQLFSNLDQLVTLSQEFLSDLEATCPELQDEDDVTNEEYLPTQFGRVVLRNVRRMAPFKRWLSEAAERDTTYNEFLKRIPGFEAWINQQQLFSSKDPHSIVYFKSALTEPFQRLTRYGLLLEQIIRFSPESDRNVKHLKEAMEKTREFCTSSQCLDTHQAATMWGLQESIEGLPSSFVNNSRNFIASLDVDEIHDSDYLRTTLLLFTDKLLIVKRPSDVGKGTGMHHAGLDKRADLVKLYSLASSATGGSQRSPKKIKQGVLKYRGTVDLLEVVAVDLGGMDVGFIFNDPPADTTERWNGRPIRRFTVASTYATPEARRAAKDTFLPQLAAAKCSYKAKFGYIALKGNAITGASEGDSTRVYWSVCRREEWDDETASKRGHIVAHVDWSGDASDLSFGIDNDPKVIMKVAIGEDETCSVRVRTKNFDEEERSIELRGFVPAVVETCLKMNLFTFPSAEDIALSPTQSRSRPRSMLLGIGMDVFGSSPVLSRGGSNASKMSAASSIFSSTSSRSPGKLLRKAAWLVSASPSKTSVDLRREISLDVHLAGSDSELDSRGRAGAASGRRKAPRRSSLPPNPSARMDISPARTTFPEALRPMDAGETTPTTPRRRVLGPRAPGSAPNNSVAHHSSFPSPATTLIITEDHSSAPSPTRTPQPKLAPIETNIFDNSFPRPESVTKRARAGDVSPLATPAKKLATGLVEDRSPDRSGETTGMTTRKKKRIVSGRSALRIDSSPRQERKSSPATETKKLVSSIDIHVDPDSTPLGRLASHIALLNSTIDDGINDKENGRGMSRSPKKPNLQDLQGAVMDIPTSVSKVESTLDVAKWIMRTNELIDDCRFAQEETSGEFSSSRQTIAWQTREIATLQQELAREKTSTQDNTLLQLDHAIAQQEIATLRQELMESTAREEKSLAQNKELEQTWNSYSNDLEQIINNNNADFDLSEQRFRDEIAALKEQLARRR